MFSSAEEIECSDSDPYPYSLRLGVLLVCAALKCAGQAGLCWRFATETADEAHIAPAATVELMRVMVALEDGQGLLSLALFGLLAPNMAVLRRCCARLNASWSGEPAAGIGSARASSPAAVGPLEAYVARPAPAEAGSVAPLMSARRSVSGSGDE
jgi:hypothetical protein